MSFQVLGMPLVRHFTVRFGSRCRHLGRHYPGRNNPGCLSGISFGLHHEWHSPTWTAMSKALDCGPLHLTAHGLLNV